MRRCSELLKEAKDFERIDPETLSMMSTLIETNVEATACKGRESLTERGDGWLHRRGAFLQYWGREEQA